MFWAIVMTSVVVLTWAVMAVFLWPGLFERIAAKLIARYERRVPHKVIGRHVDGQFLPYLIRWKITPWNVIPYKDVPDELRMWWMDWVDWVVSKLPKLWLHKFVRDDAEAMHDHPWWFCSLVLRGKYLEHSVSFDKRGYPVQTASGLDIEESLRKPMSIAFHKARHAHKIYLIGDDSSPCYTLFLTGGDSRPWGFWIATEHGPVWIPYLTADARRAKGLPVDL